MNKPTLSIVIPAYNEEKNIEYLLLSVLSQKITQGSINNIIVYCDSCTDNTPTLVKKLIKKYPIIRLFEGRNRKGKYFRIAQAFKECRSDLLIVLDADIALVGNHFFEKLILPLIADDNVKMVVAHQEMEKPKTFIGKILYTDFLLWDFIRWSIPNYDNPHNFYGSATAYRGSFARSISIPHSLINPHLYIYLLAHKGNGFRYCLEAKVRYWPIATIVDYKRMLRRSLNKRDNVLENTFSINIEKLYFVPLRYKFIGLYKLILAEPFFSPLAILLNLWLHKISFFQKIDSSPTWDITISTKQRFKHD